ncbi:MAG TPA: TetR/AcrR family transcriptional regulator [Actinomycetes bacterium]|jgi:AcrR family transcriptional regulator|nr:TetR/AcrR family transcriptional regulator [Actinomycetes bacterium]
MIVKSKEWAASRSAQPQARRRRQRADAKQSITAILQAATEALRAKPDASVEDIAHAAGVSRQTVYAHFPSREALLDAVVERAAAEVMAAVEAAGLKEAPPAVALTRLLDTGWQVAARYPFLWHLPTVTQDQDADRHGPIMDRLLEVIRRGQQSGDFDRTLPPTWLLAAGLALGRTAEDEVKAGRMTIEEATSAVHHSFLRLFGLPDPGHD